MRTLESHFRLTKTQRNGIFLLLLILVGIEGVIQWNQYNSNQQEYSSNQEIPAHILLLQKEIDENNSKWKSHAEPVEAYSTSEIELTQFNPNNYSKNDWKKFGFSDKQVDVILNYKKSLGGKFTSKKQIKDCFVISDEKYQELEPYILLPLFSIGKSHAEPVEVQSKYQNPTTKIHLTKFNPNNYSKNDWKNLGFSEKQVDVILNYKNSLGGKFTSKQQIKDCFVISDEKYQAIEPYIVLPKNSKAESHAEPVEAQPTNNESRHAEPVEAQTISNNEEPTTNKTINEVSAQDIFQYVSSKKVAYTLVKYRNSIGGFKSKEQILKVYGITEKEVDELLKTFPLQ